LVRAHGVAALVLSAGLFTYLINGIR